MKEIKNTIFYASFPLGFVSLVFPIYAASFGARGMEIGLLYSIFSIIAIVMRPIVGRLIDNRGRKLGILLGVGLYFIANLSFLMAKDINWLFIARIIQSFGASFLWLSINTYIADVSDINTRSTNYGIREQLASKGGFIGSFIGLNILFNNMGDDPFKIIFSIFSLTSILALIFTIKNVKETNHKNIVIDNKLKRHKNYKSFLGIMFTLSFITSLTAPIFLLYLQDNITNNLTMLTFLFFPSTLAYMFLPRRFGAIADKSSREKIIFIGIFFIALLQIFIPFSKGYNSFLILYTLFCIVEMFYSPALSSLIIDFVGEEKRGSSYGLYSFVSGLGAAIGPIVGGFIYERIGNDLVFYIKGVLLFALTSFVCYIYYKHITSSEEIERLLE